jgi:hypothetical protein
MNNLDLSMGSGHKINNLWWDSGLYVNGSAFYQPANRVYSGGPIRIRTEASDAWSGSYPVQISPYTDDPFAAASKGVQGYGSYTWTNSSYTSPTSSNPITAANDPNNKSPNAPYAFPKWAYMSVGSPATTTQIDASFFEPDNNSGLYPGSNFPTGVSGNWYFKFYEQHSAALGSAPDVFFHYINKGSGGANSTELATEIGAGKLGIFYIDGDLGTSGSPAGGTPIGVTIVAKGKVYVQGNYGDAGPNALNISILAGQYIDPNATDAGAGYPLTHTHCANFQSDSVLQFNGNQNTWTGVLYVPYGQMDLDGNGNNGNMKNNPNGPIVAYSFNSGYSTGGKPANNEHYGFNPIFQQPTIIVQLMGNG